MRIRLSDTRWLDIAIKVTAVLVLLGVLFLIYTVVMTNIRDREASPAARAAANLAEVVRADPNNPEARMVLADALAAAGDYRGAAEQYQAALQLRADDPRALAGLGMLSMAQKEWRTAEGYWRNVIELLEGGEFSSVDRRLEKAYYYLGSTLMEVKEYEDAALYLREALRIRRDASDTYFLLGIAYREMDSPVKYEENVLLALQFDPLLPEANYEYGKILLEKGDVAGAAERFRTSVDNAPAGRSEPQIALDELGTAEERYEKALALVASKETSAALAEARIASAIDPSAIDANRLVAKLHEQLGNLPMARAAWELVLATAPKDAEAKAAVERLSQPSKTTTTTPSVP